MGTRDICLHQIEDAALAKLPDFRVVARTKTRDELRNVIGTLRPAALIIDLDAPDSLDALVEAREQNSELALVGVTGQADSKVMIATLRAGCGQISTKPIDPNDVIVALRRALNLNNHNNVAGQTVCVFGAVGGAGATTVACYLAVGLAEAAKSRSILIDGDFDFGCVARSWDHNPQHTIGDLMTAGTVDALMLEKAVVEVGGGVSVLANPRTIEQGQAIDENSMQHIVRTAKTTYPFTVIDLPRKLDPVVGAAIEDCDKLIVVLQLTVPSVDNARRLVETFARHDMAPERIEFVINRFRKNVHKVSVELVERQLGRKMFGIIPNDYRAIASAIDVGQPVESRNPVRTAIAEIAARIVKDSPVIEQKSAPKGGWLSRLGFKREQGAGATGA